MGVRAPVPPYAPLPGAALHSAGHENWSKEEKTAANSGQEIDLPSPPARTRARAGKGWGPAWMARMQVLQRAGVWRKGWQWRVAEGGGERSEKSLPGIYCNVPRGGRQLGAAAPKWRALLCWKGVLGRAGFQEVPEVTPGQAVICVYKYRWIVMTRVDLEILKSGLTGSQAIGMTSKFNTTWSWE